MSALHNFLNRPHSNGQSSTRQSSRKEQAMAAKIAPPPTQNIRHSVPNIRTLHHDLQAQRSPNRESPPSLPYHQRGSRDFADSTIGSDLFDDTVSLDDQQIQSKPIYETHYHVAVQPDEEMQAVLDDNVSSEDGSVVHLGHEVSDDDRTQYRIESPQIKQPIPKPGRRPHSVLDKKAMQQGYFQHQSQRSEGQMALRSPIRGPARYVQTPIERLKYEEGDAEIVDDRGGRRNTYNGQPLDYDYLNNIRGEEHLYNDKHNSIGYNGGTIHGTDTAVLRSSPAGSMHQNSMPSKSRAQVRKPVAGIFDHTQTRKRSAPIELDYDEQTLKTMDYEVLKNQAFDAGPKGQPEILPKEEGLPTDAPLEERLQHYLSKDEGKQALMFSQMPVADWEESGDWLICRMGELMKQMREARKEKREVAQRFEEEIANREEKVRCKAEGLVKTLTEMRTGGEGVLRRT